MHKIIGPGTVARTLCLLATTCAGWWAAAEGAAPESRALNFVFIIADDVSAEDLGCYGNTALATPHLDRLASRSLLFENAYLTASSCSPSRSSIITGRYPHNLETAAELHGILPEGVALFPRLLRDAGYHTAHAGKTHFGTNARILEGPAAQAFEAGHRATDPNSADGDGGEGRWIERLRDRPPDRPFFLWLASFDAHRIWNAGSFSGTNRPENVHVPPYLADTPETRQDLAHYYDEISRLDHFVGEVVAELERQDVLQRTVVVFTSDNGRPFPHSKTRLYDDGIKAPLLIAWPGSGPAGVRTPALVSSIDLAPTILELAGLPAAPSMQGVSLVPILRDPAKTVRDFVFAEHNWHDFPAHVRMVRHGTFAYLRNAWPDLQLPGAADTLSSPSAAALRRLREQGILNALQADLFLVPRPSEELFDLAADPGQTTNLAGLSGHAGILERMRHLLTRWQLETGDSVPAAAERTPAGFDYSAGARTGGMRRGVPPGAATQALRIQHPGPIRERAVEATTAH